MHIHIVYASQADGTQNAVAAFRTRESAEAHIRRCTRRDPDDTTMSAAEVLGITGFWIGTLKVEE